MFQKVNDNKKSSVSNIAAKNNEIFFKPLLQPKLTVNQPNDVYEQEADAMADSVMKMHTQTVQTKLSNAGSILRKELNTGSADSYMTGIESSGEHLSKKTRSFFEPRFGYDFGNVKIHTGTVAAKSADSMNAMAYTTGNNIVFNSGLYNPQSNEGKKLLAHELTHVVQSRENGNNQIRKKEFSSTGRANEDTPEIINDTVIKSSMLTKYVGADRIKAAFLNSENFNVIQQYELEEYGNKCKQGDIADKAGGFFCRDVKSAKDKNLKGDIFVVRYLKLGYVIHEFMHKLSGPTVKNMLGIFVNEGITQYFTDQFLTEGKYDILTDHGYKDNLDCANKIVSQTNEDTVAKAYFNNDTTLISDLQKLLHLKNFIDVKPYFDQHQCIP